MTGLGEPVYVEKNDAVAEMVDMAGRHIMDFGYHRGNARAALESLGIPLTVLSALRSGEWVATPKIPTQDMLWAFSDAVQFWMEENGEDEDVYAAMIAVAPKEP